jgi:hypothetical protein
MEWCRKWCFDGAQQTTEAIDSKQIMLKTANWRTENAF